MNLYDLTRRFWQLHEQQAFQPTDTHLYWLLVNAFNARGNKGNWPEVIKYTDVMLADVAGINKRTFWASRTRLVERGLIEYTGSGIGKKNGAEYRLTCAKNTQVNTPKPVQNMHNSMHTSEPQPVHSPVQNMHNSMHRSSIYIVSIPQTPDKGKDDDVAGARTYEAEEVHPAVLADRQNLTPFEGEKPKSPPGSAAPPHDVSLAERLDQYHERIRQDRQWIEAALLTFKAPPDTLAQLLQEFTLEQQGFEKKHEDYNDYRKHAHHWIRKRLNDHANNTSPAQRSTGLNGNRHQRGSIYTAEQLQEFSRETEKLISEWDL